MEASEWGRPGVLARKMRVRSFSLSPLEVGALIGTHFFPQVRHHLTLNRWL